MWAWLLNLLSASLLGRFPVLIDLDWDLIENIAHGALAGCSAGVFLIFLIGAKSSYEQTVRS